MTYWVWTQILSDVSGILYVDLVLKPFQTVQNKNNTGLCLGLRWHTLKTESRTVNASQCLRLTVEDLISTGAPSKRYVCLCLRVPVLMSTHVPVWTVCALKKKKTHKCADMPAHSTLNASVTFSYGLLSSHACARCSNTQADKSLNYLGLSYN